MNNPLFQPRYGAVSPELLAYMEDFRAGTQPNPLGARDRVWGGEVLVEIRPFDKRIHISDIMSLHRGQGYGSKALQWLCSLADKHGVAMSLTPSAFGSENAQELDDEQLKAWYTRHGFKPHRGSLMVREPQTTLKLRPGNMRVIPMNSEPVEN